MSINLVTYANQTVTPTNDAIIYEKAIDQNGIFYGCNVTVSGNNVNITGGYGIICGREFVIESESIAVTLAPSVPLDGRLYVRLDLADADNPIQLLTAQGATLPALEQDADVNYVNGAYEMELATFTVGVSSLSNVSMTYETITGSKEILNGMVKIVDYENEQITWYSTSNAFQNWQKDITLSGYIPVSCGYAVVGSGSTFVFPSAVIIGKSNGQYILSVFLRMVGSTPSSTTQNTLNVQIIYVKENFVI